MPWGVPRRYRDVRRDSYGVPGGTGSMHGGDRQTSPGDTGSRGGMATGPQGDGQHAWGDSRGPLEIRGPRGTCSMHGGGWLWSPMGSPRKGRQRGPRQHALGRGGGDPPHSRGPQGGTATGCRRGRRGSRGVGQHGRARPEECGRPGSPGAAAASCASRPGPRRRRWVWESCRCALGQPPAATPRARRGPPRPPPTMAHIQAGLLFSLFSLHLG